ncbi:hypothetical protein [Arthrobacter sp. ERGS1:01]|uniref:hypothetical protein n=1 Tax=Arthrobacter sp. ERGS1:01 TaxID=1704044 RepID=UPI0006B4B7D2|nr:hypothetical protein [Arthrobacter sp. ERGS1:01]
MNGNDEVLTPGGMRPREMVHRVEPGQTVTGSGDITPSSADPPESMFPTAPADAGTADVGGTAGGPPAGMAPREVPGAPAAAGEPMAEGATDDLVLTPGGYRRSSLVHQIPPDHYLEAGGGSLKALHASGAELADFGVVEPRTGGRPLMPHNVAAHPGLVPALGTGWIAYASWSNGTGSPTTRFATTWVVPPVPASRDNQTIFLFNGIQNSTMIYQPVLQWGLSAAGGGNYWSVASWYADGQGGQAFHTTLVAVNPGDVLVGVMTLTGRSGNQFSYNCQFQGIANTSLPISNVDELTWNVETLEAYGLAQASDYPTTNFTAFGGIDLQTANGRPVLAWAPVDAVTDCGQSALVVSNANPGGAVDIYYRPRLTATAVTAAVNSDGRLEAFLRGTDGSVWSMWQTVPHSGPWSPTGTLGGVVKTPLSTALNTNGRLEIFGIGTDNAAYHDWQTAPHAGPWSGWSGLGGVVSELDIAVNTDGRLELFGIGGNNALYSNWQTAPHAGPWSGWYSLGGWISQVFVARNADGRLEAFGIGADHALYSTWQPSAGAGPWSGWHSLGGWVSKVAVACNTDGRLEAFGIGADNALYHAWQPSAGGGPWSGWSKLGGWISDLTVACNSDGRMEVFGIGSDGALYDIWQTVPHGGPWSGWNRLGGWVSQISADRNSDGRLEVFGIGSDGALYDIWQTVPHGGPWSGWNKLT